MLRVSERRFRPGIQSVKYTLGRILATARAVEEQVVAQLRTRRRWG
jgi:hypothetical protein